MIVTGKEAARRIREHNKIHQRAEPRSSPLITEILETAAVMFEELDEGNFKTVVRARAVKIFDDPITGRMFTTCSACDGKISPKDRFCKHCGATIIKG